jgi:uncharacterized protein (DUF2252 family)
MSAENNTASRMAAGKARREQMARSAHARIGTIDRDPIELLERNSQGRIERLIPLRYGRMMASPFSFFRGSAILQAHDLSKTSNTGLIMPICGDAHLMNFGGFATPERQLVFDLNDFDEVSLGPWEWDIKRLAASFMVAARHMRLSRLTSERLIETLVNAVPDPHAGIRAIQRTGALVRAHYLRPDAGDRRDAGAQTPVA